MRRRDLLGLMCLGPFVARAQPARRVTVAVLSTGKANEEDNFTAPFFAEMRRLGWREGQSVVYQRFFSEGSRARLPEIAAAAVAKKPDLIYAPTGAAAVAARKATATIPIVFVIVSDPVAAGLIETLPRPGGNATGVFQMGGDIVSKRMELVREALPHTERIGVMMDTRSTDYAFQRRQHEEAARPQGLGITIAAFTQFDEVSEILERFSKQGFSVVILNTSFTLAPRRREVIDLALQRRLALIGYRAEWAEAGALFSYGADLAESQQRSAEIVHRLLGGARPAVTPVERASKFELLVNQRTAKALGIKLPKLFLARADRVIE